MTKHKDDLQITLDALLSVGERIADSLERLVDTKEEQVDRPFDTFLAGTTIRTDRTAGFRNRVRNAFRRAPAITLEEAVHEVRGEMHEEQEVAIRQMIDDDHITYRHITYGLGDTVPSPVDPRYGTRMANITVPPISDDVYAPNPTTRWYIDEPAANTNEAAQEAPPGEH